MCFSLIKKSCNLNLSRTTKSKIFFFNQNIFVNSHRTVLSIFVIIFCSSPKLLNYSFSFSNFYFSSRFINIINGPLSI